MKNEKMFLTSILILISVNLYAQDKTILVFDLVNGTLDSINNIAIDTTNQEDITQYYIGDFNSNVEMLEDEEVPVVNIFPNAQFTVKKRVSLDYNLNNYPIRTSIKLRYMENGTLKNLCSGSMISQKHILTAAHCLSELNTNMLSFDSLVVCPVYDDGSTNPNFACSNVSKVFLIKDWEINDGDFAVLELEVPVGQSTGWISIGYNETNNQYEDGIFYKFSYPSIFIPAVDSVPYNGDTLYYNYGKINLVEQNFIGSINTNGIVGESGSSIIHVKNNERYTTYGVLTWSYALRHSKITEEIFYLIQHIIQEDIQVGNSDIFKEESITVFPNPTSGNLQLKNVPENRLFDIKIIDQQGKTIYVKSSFSPSEQISLSDFANGLYFLLMISDEIVRVEKIIKVE